MFSRIEIIKALLLLGRVLNFLILIRVVMSWVNVNPKSGIPQAIISITEPILGPIRYLIFNVFGYKGFIDFSPILGYFLINFLLRTIIRFL